METDMSAAYEPPSSFELGDFVELTMGKNRNDSADDTEYYK